MPQPGIMRQGTPLQPTVAWPALLRSGPARNCVQDTRALEAESLTKDRCGRNTPAAENVRAKEFR